MTGAEIIGAGVKAPGPQGPRVIAIDGPAASGKGTIAEQVAAHFGYAYLDTGLLYRAVGARVLAAQADPSDALRAEAEAKALTAADLLGEDLRGGDVASAASVVAAHGPVRAALLDFQRDFIADPPGGAPGAVLDGRDIGTVIAPGADAKLFVSARPEIRAERRWKQRVARGEAITLGDVLAEILERDKRDSGRKDAPMRAAADAVQLDTTDLTIDQAVAAAIAAIAAQFQSRPAH